MKRSLLPCLLLALAACATPPTLTLAEKADVRTALVEVCRAQQAAWNGGSVEAFMAEGYWNSDDMTFLSGGTWTRGYEPVLERFRARYAKGDAEMGRLTFSNLETLVLSEDTGIVRGRWKLAFADESETGGLFTLLMRRFEDGWRIVHDHTSTTESDT
jgi:beta-aspartyl-peptidase (threonine type)